MAPPVTVLLATLSAGFGAALVWGVPGRNAIGFMSVIEQPILEHQSA